MLVDPNDPLHIPPTSRKRSRSFADWADRLMAAKRAEEHQRASNDVGSKPTHYLSTDVAVPQSKMASMFDHAFASMRVRWR